MKQENKEIYSTRMIHEKTRLQKIQDQYPSAFVNDSELKVELNHNSFGQITAFIQIPKEYPFYAPLAKFKLNNSELFSLYELNEYKTVNNYCELFWTAKITLADLIQEFLLLFLQFLFKRLEQFLKSNLNQINQRNFIFNSILDIAKQNNKYLIFLIVFLIGILFRVLVGFGNYSGCNDPPTFGDYEAQRHWLELTYNLPPKEWYRESIVNNITYWRLDYPPLTAYHSCILGHLSAIYEPKSVELLSSYGYETQSHKFFMRITVLVTEALMFLPALYLVIMKLFQKYCAAVKSMIFLIILLSPPFILIDHGHFQYNCAMLGLVLWTVYFCLKNWLILASVAFVLSMNFKQMGLYYAMAIFAIILGKIFQKAGFTSKIINRNVNFFFMNLLQPPLYKMIAAGSNIVIIGFVVIAVQTIIILPWLTSKEDLVNFLSAIFPIKRGLYQLKVATFWCITDVIMKWQKHFSQYQLTLLSIFFTLISCVPSMLLTIFKPKKWVFTLSLFNISLAFYFFSYHVHEKTILIPLLAIILNIQIFGTYYFDFTMFALFTLYHLLKEDQLALQYYVLLFLFYYFGKNMIQSLHDIKFIRFTKLNLIKIEDVQKSVKFGSLTTLANMLSQDYIFKLHQILDYLYLKYIRQALYIIIGLLHIMDYFVVPPEKYPYLWQLLFAFVGFLAFGIVYIKSHLILFVYLKYAKNIKKIEIQKND